MPDCSSARIAIGGRIPRHRLVGFAETIIGEDLGADYGTPFSDKAAATAHIAACAVEGRPVRLYACDVPGGVFEDLEAACRELGLAYVRADDGHYTWSPSIDFWQPGMAAPCHWISLVDQDAPHLYVDTIKDLRSAGTLDAELELMTHAARFELPIAISSRIPRPRSRGRASSAARLAEAIRATSVG